MLGAAVGDAAGAVLEFQADIDSSDVARALTMPGGGSHQVGPGQVTDDTELAISCALGLLAARDGSDPLGHIARAYHAWAHSHPFDMGRTCRTAFCIPDSSRMAEAAAASHYSKANGALMRIHPLIVYAHRLGDPALVRLVRADAGLSHPNPVVVEASAAYAVAAAHLLRGAAPLQAVRAATDQTVHPEVKGWLQDAERGVLGDVRMQEGFVRWGFTLAFYHLSRGTGFLDALTDTLARGGDTDTNACIVCGLVGCHWGATGIPARLRQPVLMFDPTGCTGRRRPAWLAAGRIPMLCNLLLASV